MLVRLDVGLSALEAIELFLSDQQLDAAALGAVDAVALGAVDAAALGAVDAAALGAVVYSHQSR